MGRISPQSRNPFSDIHVSLGLKHLNPETNIKKGRVMMFKLKGIIIVVFLTVLLVFSCSGPGERSETLRAKHPLHLDDHLDAANIEGSEVPEDIPTAVEWRFDKEQPDWKAVVPLWPKVKPVKVKRIEDAIQLTLSKTNKLRDNFFGGIYIDLPDWRREDWGYVLIRARTKEKIGWLGLNFNVRDKPGTEGKKWPFHYSGEYVDIIKDGLVQTYLMRADWSWGEWKGPWKQLGIMFGSEEPASLDILSISIIPKEANYAKAKVGVSTEVRSDSYRRALFIHTPGKLVYRVKVPESGRLDVGLGVLREDIPVTFRVTAEAGENEAKTLLEETYSDKEHWAQHSVDLSGMGGKKVTLTLETDAERSGTVAFWTAPTLTGRGATDKPNIIFYVIDGAAADFMSVYGYNRRTTPNIERLAAEGAVFNNAYSNSSWTKISTPSFMTSLHNSILGGYKNDSDPLPEQAVTMAQHLHKAGYQTAVYSSNSYCGTMSSLDRGVDDLREKGVERNIASTKELHKDYWNWREVYPGEPYWVHFQTTDIHRPWKPVAPFAGLYCSPEERETYDEWVKKLREATGTREERFEKAGIDPVKLYNIARKLYDETMAHQDYMIGRMVERLKVKGEWEHTLFIIAADHSHSAAGLALLDPMPPKWGCPILASQNSWIPMIFIWPEKIDPGQRFSQPVSMIDMLPTILDLADLPMPEMMQGQSLAPLLLGKEGWEPRPVIFDEFGVDWDTEDLFGTIEVIDGRWGASLEIDPRPDDKKPKPERRRPVPLLLFNIWNDRNCVKSLHEEHPKLVEKYTKYLEELWKKHQALAKQFTRTGEVPLTKEQLRTLRTLGYIE